MLGLLLIYFIGKRFYTLAQETGHSKWGTAFSGIASYYAGTIVFGILLFIFADLLGYNPENMSDLAIGLLAMPFGGLSCYALYQYLDSRWEKEEPQLIEKMVEQEFSNPQ